MPILTTSGVSGGIPGWTDDGNGNVTAGAGSLAFDDGTVATAIDAGHVSVFSDTTDEFHELQMGTGIQSNTAADTTSTINGLPTADPHVAGEYYSVAGIIHVSAG